MSDKLVRAAILLLAASLFVAQSSEAQIRERIRDIVPGARRPAPPGQPAEGPGGSDYTHATVAEMSFGEEENQCWIFEPAQPKPASAPVIVFLHGWGAQSPLPYRSWVDHIVRHGNIVIYPRYQVLRTRGPDFNPNAILAVKSALRALQTPGHVKPDTNRFAIVGHSAGAVGAANMAAVAAAQGLPKPGALMIVQPGRGPDPDNPDPKFGIPLEDLSPVPADALALVLVGDADKIAGNAVAKDIFAKLGHIPAKNRDYIIVRSDGHADPPLVADHFSPCAGPGKGVDALDWYGYWKLFDALTDAAFYDGKNRHIALGNTPPQRYMGEWTDERMVFELVVTDTP